MEGNLRLVQREVPRDPGFSPFGRGAELHEGFNRDWWEYKQLMGRRGADFYSVLDGGGREVARLELDWRLQIDAYPTAAAVAVRPILEIQLFEVHRDLRLKGVGSSAIAIVAGEFEDRQLMALSEKADDFWASLGWSRHRHVDYDGNDEHFQILFAAP